MNALKTSLLAASAIAVTATSAAAGGYSRGSANLDPIFDTERFSSAAAVSVTSPTRKYETINGIPVNTFATGVVAGSAQLTALQAAGRVNASEGSRDFAETYYTLGATGAVDIYKGLRCAGSYAQPYGANANYGGTQLVTGTGTSTSNELSSHELGLTCAYRADVGPGTAYIIGGAFSQSVSYNEVRGFGFAAGGGDLNLSDTSYGYRIGVGYTVPEIALKTSLVYRSKVDHRVTGTVQTTGAPISALPNSTAGAFADVTTPQSLKFSVQSGVAKNVLVFGSVEWTDWSTIQQVQVFLNPNTFAAGTPALALNGVSIDGYFRDGWTVQGGVGYRFNEKLAASGSVTWDRGVSNGTNAGGRAGAAASGFTDTWTFAAGLGFEPNENVTLRGGVAYSILTSGAFRTDNTSGVPNALIGLGTDSAISGGASLSINF